MASYSVNVALAAANSGACAALIRPTGTLRPRIKSIKIVNRSVTAGELGIARIVGTGNLGTQSATTAGGPVQKADPATQTTVDTAFTAQPTLGTPTYLDRAVVAGAQGNGVIMSFPDPIVLDPNDGLALVNVGAAATGLMTATVTYDE